MLEREEAKRLEPNGYERGYYDGYHKGYDNKKSELAVIKKEMGEELRKRMDTLEIGAVYPFSVMDDIIDSEHKIMLSPDLINKVMTEELGERERRCLEMRRRDDMTLEEIGKKMNVSRERVRQIVAKAERKIRHPARIRKMQVVPYTEFAELQREHELLKAKYEALSSRIETETAKEISEKAREQTVLEKPIEVLDLSIRSYNCLKRAKCNIIADVVELEKSGKMPQVRNLGRRSAEEIRQKLAEVGL